MSLSTRAARDFKGTHTEGRTPEELRELVSHVGAELELAPAEVIIEWAVATFGDRFAITSSMGVRAAARSSRAGGATWSGSGRAALSTLPFGVSGSCSSTTTDDGTM